MVSANGKWKMLGLMGHNFLYNGDGIVFSTPLASSRHYGHESESGTLILKEEEGKKIR